MKKVCVVTWYNGTNYGTNLQAAALVLEINNLGYEVVVKGRFRGNINFIKHPILFVYRVMYKFNKKYRKMLEKKILKETIRDKKKEDKFKAFIKEYVPIININNKKEWLNFTKDCIGFVSGSDQAWNPDYFDSSMMLDFVDGSKFRKVSFAPSIGIEKVPFIYKKIYRSLLKSYTGISVREKYAKKILNEIINKEIEVVLDPTMLLKSEQWDKVVDGVDNCLFMKPYILCYFVGKREDYYLYVKKIINKTGTDCIVIPMEENVPCDKHIKKAEGIGPKEFIWLIKNATMVCTDSFHATVFSIIYHKEFYVLKRFADNTAKSQNGRLIQILSALGLLERLVDDESEFCEIPIGSYEKVEADLNRLRHDSERFLRNALSSI